MKPIIVCFLLLFTVATGSLKAQELYKFTPLIELDATDVISQGVTGTCWSFSTSSFLESELARITGEFIDLSEMYNVRNTYPQKAWNYIMRQGKTQFSEGGLAHDVINSVRDFGLVPQSAYSGLDKGATGHNHAELVAVLTAMLNTYIDNPGRKLSPKWQAAINSVLDVYLGAQPESFTYKGQSYTPESFLAFTKLKPDDYISLTSFTQAPFYKPFILNIPDNFSNGQFYNLPLDELMQVVDFALAQGYTVELDCDVSERSFSSKHGVAVIPLDDENKVKAQTGIYPERTIDQAYRQQEFENYNTTDDHLMHITGLLKDQNGTRYYKVKNSWGTNPDRTTNNGYVYFSESYMRLKTISIMIHKDAIPKSIRNKMENL